MIPKPSNFRIRLFAVVAFLFTLAILLHQSRRPGIDATKPAFVGPIAPSDSIVYCFDRYRSHIDSIYFPAGGKGIKVRDHNPYNQLTGLKDVGRTPDENIVWSRHPDNSSPFISSRLPLVDSCRANSLYSNTHVDGGNNFACVAYQLVSQQAEGGIVLYSTIIVFDRRGEAVYQLLHLKGGVSSPCVDQGGQFLTFARFVPSCKTEEGTGSNCVYSLLQEKFIYDLPVNENWNPIYLTDGYIGLMTLADVAFKRYRVFDFREKLFYDMPIPYEQVAKIKKVTRNGFLMKDQSGESKVVPYRGFAAPEKFPD